VAAILVQFSDRGKSLKQDQRWSAKSRWEKDGMSFRSHQFTNIQRGRNYIPDRHTTVLPRA
jgi:hypothetical protein